MLNSPVEEFSSPLLKANEYPMLVVLFMTRKDPNYVFKTKWIVVVADGPRSAETAAYTHIVSHLQYEGEHKTGAAMHINEAPEHIIRPATRWVWLRDVTVCDELGNPIPHYDKSHWFPEPEQCPRMSWSDRVKHYHMITGFPTSLFIAGDGRCAGTWIMGNNYRVKSSYYGGYPAGYLNRVAGLFPDKACALHLFSGRVDTDTFPGDTVDMNPELDPTYVDDAQTLENVPLEKYDIVLADPPYSTEDADHYATPMVKRNKVMSALGKRLTSGTHVVWLDQVLPMYRKDQFRVEAVIGMVKSTNHRFRVVTVFCKL